VPAPSLTLARAAGRLSRGLGRGGGTSLPGKLLLRMRPEAVAELAADLPRGATLISATNGKTTTARLVSAAARSAGWRLVANTAGANLLSGVATALLDGTAAEPDADAALFEVDEAALPEVARQLRPRVLVLMNLFRDQLDRYGELERLAADWAAMIDELPADTTLVLNADDPAVAELDDGRRKTVLFGLDDPALALPALPHAADSTRCRRCGGRLTYDQVIVGHMGHWSCPEGHLARPTPDVRAVQVRLEGTRGLTLRVATPAGEIEASPRLPGVHNAYNVTAAIATALAMGVPANGLGEAVSAAAAAFGRGERVRIDGTELVLLLAKNPAGANETVRTVLMDEGPLHLLIALNDRTADGHDVSWIWDVDYEPLLGRIARLTLTGERAYDLALRFRYAGVPREALHVEPDMGRALDAAVAGAGPDAPVYVLPTYTAMLGMREILVGRGAATAFWRDG
jgi:UDP-N-acetylmuramyl tripeptide synthase